MRIAASGQVVPPRGGMLPFPLMTCEYRASLPWAIRGAHAARSPIFGAPLMPCAWHAEQIWVNACSPLAGTFAATAVLLGWVRMARAELSWPATATCANGAVF